VTLLCQAFIAVDGAGFLSIVVPCWHHLVVMCHCHLLVIVCHHSLIALCPGHVIVGCYHRHALLSCCHPVSSLHHMVALHQWLTLARCHLCLFIVVLVLSKVGWDECEMEGTHRGG